VTRGWIEISVAAQALRVAAWRFFSCGNRHVKVLRSLWRAVQGALKTREMFKQSDASLRPRREQRHEERNRNGQTDLAASRGGNSGHRDSDSNIGRCGIVAGIATALHS
jgi:hypothetical protein